MQFLVPDAAYADVLVRKDAEILAMRDAFPGLIVTPDQLAEQPGT